MKRKFFHRRYAGFSDWWAAPVTGKDRAWGALVGGIGCLVIGALGRIMLGPLPAPMMAVVWWALGGAAAGVLSGIFFPKVTTCICFPFSTMGGGN